MARYKMWDPISREVVERMAFILGKASAAANALKDLDARLERGENAVIFQAGNSLVVGHAPPDKVTL